MLSDALLRNMSIILIFSAWERGQRMKAGIIITGTGSILALTSTDNFEHPDFVDALKEKGIDKYILFEVPEDLVKSRYGQHYLIAMADLKQSDVLRIVDVDGQRIFKNFDLRALNGPIFHEELLQKAA
jgi:cell division protein FtsI/penicillin-binding protein 2